MGDATRLKTCSIWHAAYACLSPLMDIAARSKEVVITALLAFSVRLFWGYLGKNVKRHLAGHHAMGMFG
jgi:hypothetical protein